ncbi:hypothetical protein NQ315_012535 [Exocentrus adspersus]|uniref:DNA polymerase epsilon catalytic subunit n=1 Tax=Exocentrus adspersus TaxID=1586481 RepID=A0AAV8VCP3_9CUCU|nr:hypothetical protein NQ315_012535 [Exocentrus adspersus]
MELGFIKADSDNLPRAEHCVWINFQKRKWRFQGMQRNIGQQQNKKKKSFSIVRPVTIGGFIQKAQRTLLNNTWQVLQIASTGTAGEFRLWALVQSELHMVKLIVPRMFYANLRTPKAVEEGALFKKCNRTLPRSKPVHNLYLYSVPEEVFHEFGKKMNLEQTDSSVEGVYETQVTPIFRALVHVGCVCKVLPGVQSLDRFSLDELNKASGARQPYLPKDSLKHVYFYHHKHSSKPQHMFALFLTPLKKACIIVVDTVRTNLMPNMVSLYQAERMAKKEKNPDDDLLPPEEINFEIHFIKMIKKGPTLLAIQSAMDIHDLQLHIPHFIDFPQAQIHVQDMEELYSVLDWQKVGARAIIRHYLNSERVLELMAEQCRYFHLPLGNMPADPTLFGADLFFARHLIKHNHVLWCSPTDKPDLGGSQENDARFSYTDYSLVSLTEIAQCLLLSLKLIG